MKKYLYHILCVFLLLSCTDDNFVTMQTDMTEGEKTIFTFSVNVPETSQVATRSSMNKPDIDNLYLVVFDEQGALTELSKATPVSGQDFGVDENQYYKFEVTLTQTEEKRYIHFIANYFTEEILADFSWGYEWELIPAMTVGDEQDAYWQRVELNGIYGEGTIGYESTIASLTKVPLVRNFAKITIVNKSEDDFLLEGFVVVNTLDKGSVAPYNMNKGNFVDYKNADYKNVTEEQNYVGFEPENVTMNTVIPTEFDKNTKYLYERHHRNGNQVTVKEGEQTFALVKGKFDPERKGNFENKQSTYYKVDFIFMKETNIGEDAVLNLPYYHNLLRNFNYQIVVEDVTNGGYATPEEAADKVAGNNLLASTEARPYTNISDETARIFVEYTDKTVVHYTDGITEDAESFTLKYKYYPNFNGEPTITKNEIVKHLLEEPAIGTNEAITSVQVSDKDTDDGWRMITITPNFNNLGTEVRKQVLMLYVTDEENNLILSRDVDITVRSALNMDVKCNPTSVSKVVQEDLDVNIYIPTQMDPLLFPLNFVIEAEQSTVYPNHDDNDGYMPVDVGFSLSPDKEGEMAVRYVKTLTWKDYQALTPTDGQVCIRCPFLTNKAESASRVYVQNLYFNLGVTEFSNQ